MTLYSDNKRVDMNNHLKIIKYYFDLIRYFIFKNKYPEGWGGQFVRLEKTTAKKVVFMCDGFKGHGGFTDRMKGCLTTYVEAKRHKLPFFINWTDPFNLEEFLVPSGEYDWRIDPHEINYNYADSFPVIMDISPTHGKNVIKKFIFKYSFIGKRDILVYSNMMYVKKDRPKLYHELFKPSDYLQQNIDLHLNNIGTNYWAYTFRFGNYLGDFRDIIGYPLEETEKMRLVNKNIEELKRMLKDLPKGFKALVTSDSLFFLKQVEKADNRIYIVKKELMHMDFYKKEDNKKEIWLKSFLDLYLIMRSQRVFLLRTEGMYKSSFPAFAALLGGAEFVYHEF